MSSIDPPVAQAGDYKHKEMCNCAQWHDISMMECCLDSSQTEAWETFYFCMCHHPDPQQTAVEKFNCEFTHFPGNCKLALPLRQCLMYWTRRGMTSLKRLPWLSPCEENVLLKCTGAMWERDIDYVNEFKRPSPQGWLTTNYCNFVSSENRPKSTYFSSQG